MTAEAHLPAPARPHWSGEIDGILKRLERHSRILLASDFDGTLSAIVGRPEEAVLAPATRDALDEFIPLHPRVRLAFLSGRSLVDLIERVGAGRNAIFAGNHGLEISGCREDWVHPAAAAGRIQPFTSGAPSRRAAADKAAIAWSCSKLEAWGCFTPGGMVELKRGGSPTIMKGEHAGTGVALDHVLPRAVVAELAGRFYNLEALPAKDNLRKGDRIGRRELDLARSWHAAGLLSAEGLKAVEGQAKTSKN